MGLMKPGGEVKASGARCSHFFSRVRWRGPVLACGVYFVLRNVYSPGSSLSELIPRCVKMSRAQAPGPLAVF